ncbi:hypothetical protein, partial [Bosea thiooxidans]
MLLDDALLNMDLAVMDWARDLNNPCSARSTSRAIGEFIRAISSGKAIAGPRRSARPADARAWPPGRYAGLRLLQLGAGARIL